MANLTPEQLAGLQAQMAQGYMTPDGQWVSTSQGAGYSDPNGTHVGLLNTNGGPQHLFGDGKYTVGSGQHGAQYGIYDQQGADTGRKGQYGQDWSVEMAALKSLAVLLTAGFGGAALMGAGAGGAGAGAAAGGAAGGSAAGGVGTMGMLSSGLSPVVAAAPYEMGAAALGGGGAMGAFAGAGGELGAMGAGGGLGGGVETMGALSSGLSPMSAAPAYEMGGAAAVPWEAGFEGTGALSGADAIPGAGTVSSGGGLSSLLGGASKYLGPAASAIGGLLGSQGQSKEQTTQNQIDPRLVPYLYGDNGLMPQVQQQLARSMSPERQAGWDAIRNQGLGLLSQPVAGNGFSRLVPGR